MRDAGFERIAIVGIGLVGGSLALAVRRAWPATFLLAVDSREDAVREALARGVVDAASTDLALAAQADLVVLAAPVRANLAALPSVASCTSEGTLLTDVGSTKRAVVEAARSAACARRFLGGHPLAGAASGGLGDASADLFDGKRWLFTPEADTREETSTRLQRLVAGLGAIPHVMTADEHDRVMAIVSHVPQLVASSLMNVVGEMARERGLALGGAGLADTTRLASSPPGIWRDVCATNADNIRPVLAELIETLRRLHDDMPDGDRLEKTFESAQAWRERLSARR